MWTARWIIEAYERGDALTREDLYLTYRDLRPFFDELETLGSGKGEGEAPGAAQNEKRRGWHPGSRLLRAIRN